MARLRIVAGILGILSLVIPWTLSYQNLSPYYYLSFQWIPYSLTIGFSRVMATQFYSSLITSFGFVDMALSAAGLVLIIAGSIVLFASAYHPRVGGLLLLFGFLIVTADYGYDEFKYGLFSFIPAGMILGFVGGVVGTAAKPVVKEKTLQSSSSFDDLKKLKNLLDGGVITENEFQTEKKKILDEMKQK
ncbi:MAG: SHOCT domain-containing protein [Candidatus Thermoplasmatota archaeon]|jgi:hypothetical protein|nr:SHOCT domain-containing protein [Candidatus Thermoplasmatota archaeon]MCL6002906.1 SHOCT domain-containing protein [Candidatus Thermoplasmatota archaeon]